MYWVITYICMYLENSNSDTHNLGFPSDIDYYIKTKCTTA